MVLWVVYSRNRSQRRRRNHVPDLLSFHLTSNLEHLTSVLSAPSTLFTVIAPSYPSYFESFAHSFPSHGGVPPKIEHPTRMRVLPAPSLSESKRSDRSKIPAPARKELSILTSLESTLPKSNESVSKERTLSRAKSTLTRLRDVSALDSSLPEVEGRGGPYFFAPSLHKTDELNRASDEDTSPERAQRSEGPLR